MEHKKVLLVAFNDLGLGGMQSVIMNIVRNLSDEFVFDIVCFDTDRTDFDDEFKSYGGKIILAENKSFQKSLLHRLDFYVRGRRIYSELKKIIRENGPYIAVHSHKQTESGLVLKAAKECGVPVRIAHAHTAVESKLNFVAAIYVRHLKKLLFRNATSLVGCSSGAGKSLFGEERDFRVVYNTIDRKFLKPFDECCKHDAPHILQVGMICENKNQMFSADVFAELKKTYPNARMTFIGEPKDDTMQKYSAKLIEKSKQLGIFDSMAFLPADSDVLSELGKCDYVIFPSLSEGLGIVPIEAQAQGVGCFVSSSVSNEVDCGGCEFIDLADGADVWAKRIAERFATDGGKKEKYDITRFMPDTIMEQYKKLYDGEII